MTYRTLMVHLELAHPNAGRLRIAGDLAERFGAAVVGIAVCQPARIVYGASSGSLVELDRKEIEKHIEEAEAEFRSALQGRSGTLEWRSSLMFGSLSDHLAREARCGDLLITGVSSGALLDGSGRVDTGDLVMQVGRPVLIVPAGAQTLKLERAVVGWKDTRETRRAITDALPLLKKAAHVIVIEIAPEEELDGVRQHLEDVVAWLKRHGVTAGTIATPPTGSDAIQLADLAQNLGADLIVAGAYGHSRVREWVLGGVTRDLLLGSNLCTLLSH